MNKERLIVFQIHVMEIPEDSIIPSRVIGLFKVEEYCYEKLVHSKGRVSVFQAGQGQEVLIPMKRHLGSLIQLQVFQIHMS